MLLHPRVEFTQYEPLPAMELREGVRITCLASGISCQQGAEMFHSTKESWCLGESTGGRSSLRQPASEKKGNLPYRTHNINILPRLSQENYLPFLPAFSSKPSFEASTCGDHQFSAGCHIAAWPSFIFSCKQKKWLTHRFMGVREKRAHLDISQPEEFRYLQPNAAILHLFYVYMKPSNTD